MTNPMPPQGPQAPDDPMPGEAELRALYGKLPQNEPGPALDAAVLRAAAEALSASDAPTSKTRTRAPRWLIGLSSAATLVLAAGLAWHMRGMPQTDSGAGDVPAASDDVAAKAGNAPAPVTPEMSRDNASVKMAAPAALPPPPPPEPPKQSPARRMIEAARSRHVMKTAADKPAAPAVHGYAADALEVRAAAPVLKETESVRQSASPLTGSAADKAVRPPPRIQAQVIAPAPPAAVEEMAAGKLAPVETPAQQLEKIRQLYAQGHDDAALKRLLAFRRNHPKWTLPDDLVKRLQQP